MKKIKSVSIAMSALVLASCGGAGSTEDVKENALDSAKVFAVDVATKVSKGQKDSLVALFPDVAKADSISLTFVADSINVVEVDSVNYLAKFDGGKEFSIAKDAQGKFAVTESKGLFVYPEKDLDFAKKTGMWVDSLTDVQFAERMATMSEFRKYLIGTFIPPKPLVIKKGKYKTNVGMCAQEWLTEIQYIVTNNSDKAISGQDYNVVAKYADYSFGGDFYKKTEKGKDIAPRGSVVFEFAHGYYYIIEKVNVVYTKANANKAQLFEENFQPKGNEYEQFLKTKKK